MIICDDDNSDYHSHSGAEDDRDERCAGGGGHDDVHPMLFQSLEQIMMETREPLEWHFKQLDHEMGLSFRTNFNFALVGHLLKGGWSLAFGLTMTFGGCKTGSSMGLFSLRRDGSSQ